MKKLDLSRSNSICPPPETVLVESVKNNDIENIKTLINANSNLLNYEYPSTKTILPLACSEKVDPETIQTLIDLGGNLDGNSEWKPLHVATQNTKKDILEVILNNLKPGKINETVDGNTALHALVKCPEVKEQEMEFCANIEMLFKAGINVNQGDGKNVSAILWAAKYGYKEMIRTILEKSIEHVDLDNHKLRGKSARDLIKEKRLYDGVLPEKIQYQNPKDRLFSLLKESKENDFEKYFNNLNLTNPGDIVNSDDNTSTFLQYSCEKGLAKIVKLLLDRGANVNLVTQNNDKSPIKLVTENGYFEIFQLLLDQPDLMISSNILCYLIKKIDNPKFEKIDHEKCCRILLKKLEANRTFLDVNGEDELKNTPIHYSLRYADEEITDTLLKLGASLACKNGFGSMPVEDIKPEVLERHLDDCIKFNIKNKNDEKRDFEVIFDYHSLIPPRKSRERLKLEESDPEIQPNNYEILPETEVISYMSKAPEFKDLLKHPVIVSFLFMKWHRIRCLFYINLLFYILFVLSLVVYIFTYYGNFNEENESELCLVLGKISCFTLNVTFLILLFRELFQMTVSPRNYYQNFENLVEIILIILTGMILYISSPSDDTRRQLSSISILLAAFELVLMVGQHPKLSTNVVMLKTVSVNFFKLLLWYSLLIVAFALSFYILFAKPEQGHNSNSTNTDEEEDFFMGPGKSLFKTIVMLTGEFDAGSINFHTYPITSKLIFSLFVFMITIILLNLLNGLAVSDTQTIKNDAELVGHIARAQHIHYVESMLLGNVLPTSLLKIAQNFCCFPFDREATCTCFKPLARKVCLFTKSQSCQLCVLPNDHGKIYYEFDSGGNRKGSLSCARGCSDNYLDKETVKRIGAIVKRRRFERDSNMNVQTLCAEIIALKAKLDLISKTLMRNQYES